MPGFSLAPLIVQGSLTFIPAIDHQIQGFVAAFVGLGLVITAVGYRGKLIRGKDHAADAFAETTGFHPVQYSAHHQRNAFRAFAVSAFRHAQFQQHGLLLLCQLHHRQGRRGGFRFCGDGGRFCGSCGRHRHRLSRCLGFFRSGGETAGQKKQNREKKNSFFHKTLHYTMLFYHYSTKNRESQTDHGIHFVIFYKKTETGKEALPK